MELRMVERRLCVCELSERGRLDSGRRSSHIRRHSLPSRNKYYTTLMYLSSQVNAAEKTETFHMQNLCPPRCCHRHAVNNTTRLHDSAMAMVLCKSMPLSRSPARLPCWATRNGRRRRSSEKKACTKPSANPVADLPWCKLCKQPTRIIREN